MPLVTFRVLEGIDKGRIFRDLPTPVTVGREEGNMLRLNDERVSRFHAKVQFDNNETILTDLESTNGTRVNGNVIQAARLAELLDFLHRHLTHATEHMHAEENATQVTLSFSDWQRILALQMVLAQYVRAVAEPEILEE